MNKIRRKTIADIMARLDALYDEVQSVMAEETEARDALPESLQESERYEAMDEAVDNLDYALSSIEDAREYLESAAE